MKFLPTSKNAKLAPRIRERKIAKIGKNGLTCVGTHVMLFSLFYIILTKSIFENSFSFRV
jgi:hypothetical protein